jgi:hypothetical protein
MIISTAMVQMVVSHEYIGITTQMAVTDRNLGGAVGTVVYVNHTFRAIEAQHRQVRSSPISYVWCSPGQFVRRFKSSYWGGAI